jgi:hypothetical protein
MVVMKRAIWLIVIILIAIPAFAQDEGEGGGGFGGFGGGGFGGGFEEGDNAGNAGIEGPAIGTRAPKMDPLADIRSWLGKAGAPAIDKKQLKPLNQLYQREVKLMEKSFENKFGVSLESALAAERGPSRGRRGGRAANAEQTTELHHLLDHLSDMIVASLRMDQQAALRKYQSEQLRVKRIALMKQKLTTIGLTLTSEQDSQLDDVYARESRLRTLAIIEAKGDPYDKTITILEKQTSQRVVQLLNQNQKAILSAAITKAKPPQGE